MTCQNISKCRIQVSGEIRLSTILRSAGMESVPVPYLYQTAGTGTGRMTDEFQIFGTGYGKGTG